jgi:hypothetical protein
MRAFASFWAFLDALLSVETSSTRGLSMLQVAHT